MEFAHRQRLGIWLKSEWGAYALLTVLALVAFWNSLGAAFVSDDYDFLYTIAGSSEAWWHWFFAPQNAGPLFYRPLHNIFFILGKAVFGLTPWPYHVAIVLLHAFTAVVVYRSLRQVATLPRKLVLLLAALWVVAPVHAESVAWVTGGVSVLAGLPAALSLYYYIKARTRNVRHYFEIAAVWWFVSLLAKESTLTWPVALLLLDVIVLQSGGLWQRFKHMLFPKVCFVLVGIVYFIVRYSALGTLVGGYGQAIHTQFDLAGMAKMLVSSLLLFVSSGAVKYQAALMAYNHLWPSMVCVIVVAVIGYKFTKYRHLYTWGALVFLISILPQLNLGINLLTSEGERYLYLPALGVAIVVATCVWSIPRQNLRASAVILLFCSSLLLLMPRVMNWKTAGDYAARAIQQLVQVLKERPTSLVLLAPPDNYQGAFIFRNGLREALLLSGETLPPQLIITSSKTYLRPGLTIAWQNTRREIKGTASKPTFNVLPALPHESYQFSFIGEQMIESRYNFTLATTYIFAHLPATQAVTAITFDEIGAKKLFTVEP